MNGYVKLPLGVLQSIAFINHSFPSNQLFLIMGVILNEIYSVILGN